VSNNTLLTIATKTAGVQEVIRCDKHLGQLEQSLVAMDWSEMDRTPTDKECTLCFNAQPPKTL